MADITNMTGVASNSDIFNALLNIPGISTVIRLSKVALVVVIAYLVFLIIRSIVQIRYSRNFSKMTKNVEEINQKMDILIGKKKFK